MTSDDVINALTRQRHMLLETIAGLPDEALDRKGTVGEWSLKNLLAHLASWEVIVTQITPERVATGKQSELIYRLNADEDAANAEQVGSREHLSPREQIAELEQSRAALLAMIRGFGDETLNRDHPWDGWDGTLGDYFLANINGHEQEHFDAARTAAESLRAASN